MAKLLSQKRALESHYEKWWLLNSHQHSMAQWICSLGVCVRCGARRIDFSRPHIQNVQRGAPLQIELYTLAASESKSTSLSFRIENEFISEKRGRLRELKFQLHRAIWITCALSAYRTEERLLYINCLTPRAAYYNATMCCFNNSSHSPKELYIFCIIYIWPNEILAVLLQPSSSSSQHLLWNAIRGGDIIPAPASRAASRCAATRLVLTESETIFHW